MDDMLVTSPVHVVRHFGTNCCLLGYCSIIKFSLQKYFTHEFWYPTYWHLKNIYVSG